MIWDLKFSSPANHGAQFRAAPLLKISGCGPGSRILLLDIEKKGSKKLRFFHNYSSRLARVLRTIREQAEPEQLEEMLMRKPTKNYWARHIWKYCLKKQYLEVIKLRSKMIQWNFQMKKFWWKSLANCAKQCSAKSEKLLRKMLFVLYYTIIDKIEIFHVLQ